MADDKPRGYEFDDTPVPGTPRALPGPVGQPAEPSGAPAQGSGDARQGASQQAQSTGAPQHAQGDRIDEEATRTNLGDLRIGIIGGRSTGKTFLFQAMVKRLLASAKCAGLRPFISPGDLNFSGEWRNDDGTSLKPPFATLYEFLESYNGWQKLRTTQGSRVEHYSVGATIRTGVLGDKVSQLNLRFLDAQGERIADGFDAFVLGKSIWADAYVLADVLVYCVPLWVVFPRENLGPQDLTLIEDCIKDLERISEHMRQVRASTPNLRPQWSVIALTMADDERCALSSVRDRWIKPVQQDPAAEQRFLDELDKRGNLSRYLAGASQVSKALAREFNRHPRSAFGHLLDRLHVNASAPPWLVPVSAIEGRYINAPDRPRHEPIPAHVELPLLLGLIERFNVLM